MAVSEKSDLVNMVTGFLQCKPYQRARWEPQKLLLMWPYKSLSHVSYILLVHTKPAHIHGEGAIQGLEHQEARFIVGAIFKNNLPRWGFLWQGQGWRNKVKGSQGRTAQLLSWTFSEMLSFIDFIVILCHLPQ